MKKITIITLMALLLVSSAIGLISTNYGDGVIKGNYLLFKGGVDEKITEDISIVPKNYTLNQFVNIDLDEFDFKVTNTNEIIFDKSKNELYFVYTFISGTPIYNNETGLFDGLAKKKYEYKQPYPYIKYKICRQQSKSANVCVNEAQTESDKSIDLKIERQRKRFISLQNKALNIIQNNNDIVYNDIVNNLE